MGIEDELTGSQLIGPIKKVLTFTDQELTTEEQSLRSYIMDRVFPTSRHDKLERLKKGEHEAVAQEVIAVAQKDNEVRKELTRLVNEVHANISIEDSEIKDAFVVGGQGNVTNVTYNIGKQSSSTSTHEQTEFGRIDNLPPRNPNFTGRENLLGELRNQLANDKTTALTAAIHGLGGIGKTQVALEYAHQYAEEYKIIWWLHAGAVDAQKDETKESKDKETAVSLGGDIAELARELKLPEANAQDQRITIAAVISYLKTSSHSWLLIFDNSEDPSSIEGYLPGGKGHVLITSRYAAWGGIAEPLPVDILPVDEAIAFLLKRTKQKDEVSAKELAEELGCLPLALEQAGAYIEQSAIKLADYLALYRKKRHELFKPEATKPLDYPDTVLTTWLISMEKLRARNSTATDLLNLCAFFAPDKIPLDVIVAESEFLPESLAACLKDSNQLNQTAISLRAYSFINRDGNNLSIHRLVQAVTRDELSDKEKKKWAGLAVSIVNKAYPFDSDDVRTWDDCERLLLHGLASAGHAEQLQTHSDETGRLLNQCGLYLQGRARYHEAKDKYERALQIGEATLGKDHPKVAIRVNNLGSVLKDLGDLSGAKSHYERALKIGEAALGKDHPAVAIRVNNLGDVLQDLGDLSGAKSHYERALKIGEAALGKDHPKVAIRVNNLGDVLQDLGDLSGAKENYERALRIDEAAFGPDHPNVATDVNNLGMVLKDLGDQEGAKENYERALRIDEAAFGPDHPNVARDVNNLGMVLKDLGDQEGAKENLERALKILGKFLGPDHPNTKTVQNNLDQLIEEMKSK